MAEDKKQQKQQKQPSKDDKKAIQEKKFQEKAEKEKKERRTEREMPDEALIRILGYDIISSKKVYPGLTRIKGVSWAISNVICRQLNIPLGKKISDLSKDEIKHIEETLKNLQVKDYLMNRRRDIKTGETKHYLGSDLDMKKDFDIRRMKKIRSYKGVRHTASQPVRGQRTRSHFRQRNKAVGVRRKK
jgi:small subunit ribosomal protein S13